MKLCVAIGTKINPTVPVPLGGDFVDQMRIAKDIGFDAVELHLPAISLMNVSEVLAESRRLGISVTTLGTGAIFSRFGLSLLERDDLKRDLLLKMLKQFIDSAAELGSMVTIGSVKGNHAPEETLESALERLGATLAVLDEYARSLNVTLLIEATNRYENNVLNTGTEAASLIREHQLTNTKILLDSFHCNIEEREFDSCITTIAPFLGHVHIADNTRGYPGSGCLNIDLFAKQLKSIKYDGVVSIECLPKPTGLEAAKQGFKYLREHFNW